MLSLPDRVQVVEVGPRDGLQSLDKWIDTGTKIEMINRLSRCGLPVIEVSSFVHPKVVPNLVDAEAVIEGIERRPGTVYRALVPNKRGAMRALETSIDEVLGLFTVSETYLAKNQNMTVDEAIEAQGQVFRLVDDGGRAFIMAIGVSMYCPYEGLIPPEQTLHCIERLYHKGIRRFYLAASTGMEEPRQVHALFHNVNERYPDCEFGFHVHEKMGLASANLLAALQAGATMVEGSICGIGGGMAFPDGHGSVGNLPTEDIVQFLCAMNIETDVSPANALQAARDIGALLDIPLNSRLAQVGPRSL